MSGITGSGITEPAYTTDMVVSGSSVVSLAAGTTATGLTFTAPTGGRAPYTHSVTATGVTISNSTTLTPTVSGLVNGQQVIVTCTSLDSNVGVAQQRTVQTKTIVVGEGSPSMEADVLTSVSTGTTSQAFTFASATGGKLPYSYSCVLVAGSPGTLTVNADNKSGTISGMLDGDEYAVVCTVTDAAGRTDSAVKAYGVGVTPGATYAEWEPVETIDFQTMTGTYTANTTLDGRTYTLTGLNSPGTKTLTFDATNGMGIYGTTAGTTDSSAVAIRLNQTNFRYGEEFILEFICKFDALVLSSGGNFFVSSVTSVNGNSQLGVQFLGTGTNAGAIKSRKCTGGAITQGNNMTTSVVVGDWYSVQLIIKDGSILYVSAAKSAEFLGGYSYNAGTVGSGTWSDYLGGIAKTIGTGIPTGPFASNMYFLVSSYGATTPTYVKKMQVLRATRPRRA